MPVLPRARERGLSHRQAPFPKQCTCRTYLVSIVKYIVERIRTVQLQHLYIWLAERDILEGFVERAPDTNLPDFLYSKSTNRGVASLLIQRWTNAAAEQEPANASVGGAPDLEGARQVDLETGQDERDNNVDTTTERAEVLAVSVEDDVGMEESPDDDSSRSVSILTRMGTIFRIYR